METIRGKTSLEINASELAIRIAGYKNIRIDIGTGDGRYVRSMAQKRPDEFFIGVDACRENLREHSLSAPANALFVIARAQALPYEFAKLADEVTINFPWGSLLESLLAGDPALFKSLKMICKPTASLQVRLNGGALQETDWNLEEGTQQICHTLSDADFQVGRLVLMYANDLRVYPTTWARRLAYGRDPRAFLLSAKWTAGTPQFQTSCARVANA